MRRSGILMPISSLPGKYGIGTFSKEAYAFVDFLKDAGQKLWQILPLGPTGYGDSPYQSFSTFAGNPYFIDLDALVKEGFLTQEECEALDWGESEDAVDYGKLYTSKFQILRLAFSRADLKKNKVKILYNTKRMNELISNILLSLHVIESGLLIMPCLWQSRMHMTVSAFTGGKKTWCCAKKPLWSNAEEIMRKIFFFMSFCSMFLISSGRL